MSDTSPRQPAYAARSPTLPLYSPTNGSHSRAIYNSSNNHPPTPAPLPLPPTAHSPHYRQPRSPPLNGLSPINGSAHRMRDKPSSTYYDPTSDQPESTASWRSSHHQPRQSPIQSQQVRYSVSSRSGSATRSLPSPGASHGPANGPLINPVQGRTPHAYLDNSADTASYHNRHQSPVKVSPRQYSPQHPRQSQSPSRHASTPRSPVRSAWETDPSYHHRNGDTLPTTAARVEPSPSPMVSRREPTKSEQTLTQTRRNRAEQIRWRSPVFCRIRQTNLQPRRLRHM